MTKKGLIFALYFNFPPNFQVIHMVKNVDDYYSSISWDDSWIAWSVKKPVIKKKLKVKAKKVVTPAEKKNQESSPTHTEDQTVSQDAIEATEWASLNDMLGNEKKTSGFKVVARWEDKVSVSRASKADRQEVSKPKKYSDQASESKKAPEQDSWDKWVPKFKAWFSRQAKKTYSWSDGNSDKNTKKAKFYPWNKRGKYKNNIDDEGFTRSNKLKNRKKEEKNVEDIQQNLTVRTWETVIVWDILSLKELSEKIGVSMAQLIGEFMKNGMMMTINSKVDFDTASLIAESFEVKLERDISWGIGVDDIADGNIKDLLLEDDSTNLEIRPPVISIMGHVDHGKTSLLDYIRKAKVASGEAGWITQSVWAYQAEYNNKKITFLDTPWHEAFTIMRSRWAKSTDIAILVVAADEWVKPQTKESISHAKEAGIPVIVAINKMDKEWANPDHVKGQLAEQWLTPEDWGGDTPMVPVSAQTGFGIEDLLEIILLVAEMLELKANANRNAVATVLESHLDTKLGPVATLLINTGTLEKWAAVVCGESYGKIKVLRDYTGKSVKKSLPWDPALIVWLDKVVAWWDILQMMNGIDSARQKALEYSEYLSNQKKLQSSQLDILMSKIKSWNLKHLKVVLKADTNGSLEAIKNSLLKLSTDETSVSVIHSGVGNITEWDVLMCGWSSALLIWFGVNVGPNARGALEDSWVEYIESKIIYHITERVEKIVSWMLDPKEVEYALCEAKVLKIFFTSKKFHILGLSIKSEEETIENGALIRVVRGDKVVWKWKIESLKQWVEEVNKLEWPIECGIKFSGYNSIEEKDVLEVYKVVIEK